MLGGLLDVLGLRLEEPFVAVKENGLADANFIITNLMKGIFAGGRTSSVCLVTFHNTIGHYQSVGKKLGYDLLHMRQDGRAAVVEPLKAIVDDIGNDCDSFLSPNNEVALKQLFESVREKVELLKAVGHVYVIVDDISHMLDLGVDIKYVLSFINCCANLTGDDRVHVIINAHVSDASSELIANALNHVASINVEVSALKTGISRDVTGVVKVSRLKDCGSIVANIHHYKAFDRNIKVFAPGESTFHLFK